MADKKRDTNPKIKPETRENEVKEAEVKEAEVKEAEVKEAEVKEAEADAFAEEKKDDRPGTQAMQVATKIGSTYRRSVKDEENKELPDEIKKLNKKNKKGAAETHSGHERTPLKPDADPDAVVEALRKKAKIKRTKKLNRSVAGNGILFFIMAICGIFMSLPLVMIINNCLKPLDEIFQYPPKIFVRNPTFENFTDLFTVMSDSWVPFSRYILNTIIITGLGTFGHVIVASLAAYPLAKHEFPFKKLLFNMVVLSMMFSWTVTQIPNYMIISWLHINNTYLALILPAWQYGMGLYLMKQFMEQLPDSLMESARLDGATEYQIFWKIVMPNVKPAWLTLAIFQFQQMWGNTGSMFLRDEQLKPLQFALQQVAAGGTARAGASAAVTFIIAAVPIIFFLACQSNVLETMTTSGMKE